MWEVRQVNSSAIALIGFNREQQKLRIIFRRDMTGYDFCASEHDFLALANAQSVGQEFQTLRMRAKKDGSASRISDYSAQLWAAKANYAINCQRVVISD